LSISEAFAIEHTNKWLEAWNNHDLEAVLSMYSETVEFSSPKIKAVFPQRNTAKINNKDELRKYWAEALKNKFPNLKFIQKEVLFHKGIVILEYYATLDGLHKTSVIEKFEFKDGLVSKSDVFYGAEEPI
jgi:ketosteroid isomerase-like protein